MVAHRPVGGELVLVEVDDVRFRVLIEQRRHLEEHVGREGIVVVEKRDELALGDGKRGIGITGDAEILRQIA